MAFLLFATLLCASGVWGQENTEHTLYVELSTNNYSQASTPTALGRGAQEFVNQIAAFLVEQNITGIWVDDNDTNTQPYFWEQPSLHLSVTDYGSTFDVSLTPYRTMLLPTSGILESAFSISSIISVDLSSGAFSDAALALTNGFVYYSLEDWENAIHAFARLLDTQRMLDNNPYLRSSVHFYLANCFIETGDLQQARILYETILNDPANNVENTWSAAVNLAWIDLHEENQDTAFERLDAAIESMLAHENYFSVYALTRRSQLYALAFRFDEAIADMDAAIELDPGNPYLYVERGQRILLLYEWDRALADYNHAIELDPNYADAFYYRGILYASVPEGVDARAEAVADFQHYLDLAAPLGAHTEDAQRYIAEIQVQLEAVGN